MLREYVYNNDYHNMEVGVLAYDFDLPFDFIVE